MSPEQQVAGWRNGHVDAVIGYEPTATMLQRAGAKRLFDSRQMPDTILDVLAVRNDRMGGHSDAMKALVAAHFRGLAHLQVNRQDAVYRIASRQGMTPKEVQQALGGVVLPSLEANRQYLAQPHGRLVVAARNVSTLMVNGGLLKAQDTLVDIGTAAWLPRDEG
jgi:NitT/TauT family transport system substrate-binding protein